MTTTHPRILLVDDDLPLREVVRYALAREGFEVIEAGDGERALVLVAERTPDLLVLDVNLPRLDGLAVCRRVREHSSVPILFLSCRGDELDRVLGLDLGGDDYVTKPFAVRELVSRVRAILRRGRGDGLGPADLAVGSLKICPALHRVYARDNEVRFTATELRLLTAIVRARARVLGRDELSRVA